MISISIHAAPHRGAYTGTDGTVPARYAEQLDQIADRVYAAGGVAVEVIEAPVSASPDSDFWFVLATDLNWHLQSISESEDLFTITSRFVVLRSDQDDSMPLLENLRVAAIIEHSGAAGWHEDQATSRLLVPREVASRIGANAGARPASSVQTEPYVTVAKPADAMFAIHVVNYLRTFRGGGTRLVRPPSRDPEFPIGRALGDGNFVIERHLQGRGLQQLFLGRHVRDGNDLLIAHDKLSRVDIKDFQHSISYESADVLRLEFVGKSDVIATAPVDADHFSRWFLVERATRGSWLPSLLGRFEPEVVFEQEPRRLPSYDPMTALTNALSLGQTAGRILSTAAKNGQFLARCRPEYMWAESVRGRMEVTGLSARADAFFAKSKVDAVTWPLFDRFYYAPEAQGGERVDDRALSFSLAIMIAEWATGRFPYGSKHHPNGVLSGNHEHLDLPPRLAALLSRAMRLAPAERPSLGLFLDELAVVAT